MSNLKEEIIKILKSELKRVQLNGVQHLGYRYFLPNGKSLGFPTIESWNEIIKDKNYNHDMKQYLSNELLYLSRNNFQYVTRANDHSNDHYENENDDNKYLIHLKSLGLNNSIGIYLFSKQRIDSFFFICNPEYIVNHLALG